MVKTFNLEAEPQRSPAAKGRPPRQSKRARDKNALDGWIVLDKPVGLTSTQALAAVKRLLWPKKAGHAGTLDPLASGLLPLALGEATKTVPFVVDGTKSYRFTLQWGAQTDTDDADGTVMATSDVRPAPEAVKAALGGFVGTVMQVPPQFSAVKIGGQRAYDLARDGETVTLQARPVIIHRLEIVAADEQTLTLEADCGKGTYVRAVARDLAAALGAKAFVTALRRTRVGPFGEDDMVTLDGLDAAVASDPQRAVDETMFTPAAALAELPHVMVDRNAAGRLRRGQRTLLRPGDDPVDDGEVCACHGGELVALCTAQLGELQPVRVFARPRRRITVVAQNSAPADHA